MPGCLALDLGTRRMGWACGVARPVHGLVAPLPGTVDFRQLMLGFRNELEALIEEHEPDGIRFVPRFSTVGRTDVRTAEGMGGLQGVLYLAAGDYGLDVWRTDERTARKVILGKCDFGRKNKAGGLVAGGGREEAKTLVLEWCEAQRYQPLSHDVGDALVLWHYDQVHRLGREGVRSALVMQR